MSNGAVLASRSGSVRDWLQEAVRVSGYDIEATLAVDAEEDGQYNIPPGLVEEIQGAVEDDTVSFVGIDELLHPGQLVDLTEALPNTTVQDRRDIVYNRLAAGNQAARHQQEIRRQQIERRRAARDQRASDQEGPSGTSGAVAEPDRQIEQREERLESVRMETVRRVADSYDAVDGSVVIVGPPAVGTTPLWAELVGKSAERTGPFEPATPTTAVTRVGPHEIVVADTPGIVGTVPDWFAKAVPGVRAFLERATVVVVVGDSPAAIEQLAGGIAEHTEATILRGLSEGKAARAGADLLDATDSATVRKAIAGALPTARLSLRLPYEDDAHALVSELHERAVVREIEYGESITLTVDIAASRSDEIRRQVAAVGGESTHTAGCKDI